MEHWAETLRRQFPAAQKGGYLDAAYDMGGASFMREAANRFFDEWSEAALSCERGGPGRARFFAMADETRRLIAKLLGGGDESNVCFTHNTNEGINLAVMGFRYEKGDNIVSFRDDFPSVVGPCLNAERLLGVEVRLADTEQPGIDDIDALMALCDEKTRLIVISHVRSATGYTVDLQRLGGLCRERGIFLIVDATQSIGTVPIKALEWGIGAVSAAGYKCLLAGIGSAFFFMSGDLAEKVTPVFVSYNDYTRINSLEGTLSLADGRDARKLESGTIDVLEIAILKSGLEQLLAIGIDTIAAHIGGLYEKLYRGLAALGYDIVTPFDPKLRSASLAVRVHGDQKTLYDHFRSEGICLSSSRHIRFGIPAFALESDIDMALAAAAKTDIR
ncbi:MAG: aminotransferase class V-fold PLP-dependent enzyme [Clostridia bacterium]|nr:aminotransferase class V-fold PLP-dependent enzyme [Clostridia bacterium]